MAGRRLNILVAGGVDDTDETALERPPGDALAFAAVLGREIMQQDHALLTGCRTSLDAAVAEGAYDYLASQAAEPDEIRARIVSYVNQGTQPKHSFGDVLQSELADWELGGEDLTAPEIIHEAHAVILIGGFSGTFRAANWARIERKPLLPVALFGGAAKTICLSSAKTIEVLYPGSLRRQDYEAVLKSLSTDWPDLATRVLTLAERMTTSRDVFVVMSFAESPEYKDLKNAIEETCSQFGYKARRVDEADDQNRILPEILRGIRHSAFVVADVTEGRPNVYWELGLAAGLDKEVIVIAKKGTDLPFDINDVPVLFWESFSDFKESLARRVQKIASGQGGGLTPAAVRALAGGVPLECGVERAGATVVPLTESPHDATRRRARPHGQGCRRPRRS